MSGYGISTVADAPDAAQDTIDYVAICDQYLPLVKHAVSSYAYRLPGYVDVDDLEGAALVGLVLAAKRFDPDKGVPFEAWALQRIRGAILDAARSADFATRRTRSEAREADRAIEALTQQLGRTPSDQEITDHLGMSLKELSSLRSRVHQGLVVSLDATYTDGAFDDGETSYAETLVDADMPPLETLERRELDAYVRDCVESLPERLKWIVEAYFFHGKTSTEIAEELGVTESRVSQLRSDAMRLLREALGAQYDEIATATSGKKSSASGGISARGAEVAKAAAARSTYASRLSGTGKPASFI